MAALMFTVPEETARILREIQVPGVPEKADSHITVAYLGDDVPIERIGRLLPVLYEVTATTLPFTVSTDLITTFPPGNDGVPVIAKVRSPELHAFRKALCDAMEQADIEYDRKYPVYKPHVTLAYAKDPTTLFELDIPEVTWPAHELLLWGSNRGSGRLVVKFPLSLPIGKIASDSALQRAMVQLALYRMRCGSSDQRLGTLIHNLAKKHFGAPGGKRWGERSSHDDTLRLVFADDDGRQPGRGMGRNATVDRLLSKFRDDMPKGLPRFLEELDALLKSDRYEIDGWPKAVSISWKGRSGEDEEWSIDVPHR